MVAQTDEDRATGEGAGRRLRRPAVLLWVLAGLVAAALLVGAVAGALRTPAELPEDSPEGTVQDYLQAVFDGDTTTARGLLSEDAAEACSAADYRRAWVPESLTASLDGVRITDGRAEVDVRLRTVAGPEPFAGDDFSSRETFVLADEDEGWRLTGQPWPVLDCEVPR